MNRNRVCKVFDEAYQGINGHFSRLMHIQSLLVSFYLQFPGLKGALSANDVRRGEVRFNKIKVVSTGKIKISFCSNGHRQCRKALNSRANYGTYGCLKLEISKSMIIAMMMTIIIYALKNNSCFLFHKI